jgi:hypothetical protein
MHYSHMLIIMSTVRYIDHHLNNSYYLYFKHLPYDDMMNDDVIDAVIFTMLLIINL